MPSPAAKRTAYLFAALIAAIVLAAGYFFIQLTGHVDIEYQQDPNAVEAREANRKLKLFNDAQASRKQGFIRLSEVEINSFLESQFHNTNQVHTNAAVTLARSAVLLGSNRLTFVNWLEKRMLGVHLSFIWQRVVVPEKTDEGWTFKLEGMHLGRLEIQPRFWNYVSELFGGNDRVFSERANWLRQLPTVKLARNEFSHTPELRLYTYVPQAKAAK